MQKLVVYKYGNEVIVTTPQGEKQMLKDYFTPNTGRELIDYTRLECKVAVSIMNIDLHVE